MSKSLLEGKERFETVPSCSPMIYFPMPSGWQTCFCKGQDHVAMESLSQLLNSVLCKRDHGQHESPNPSLNYKLPQDIDLVLITFVPTVPKTQMFSKCLLKKQKSK